MRVFNLAEELEKERKKNKELEEKIKELKADYGNKAQVERDLLQIRINKAIEYIEKVSPCMSDDEGGTLYMTSTIWGEDLLNILKGDNNDK